MDLVYFHPEHPAAFEIASSIRHSRRGLYAFARRFPRSAGHCWLVAPGARFVPPERDPDGVGTLPLDLFLVAVGRQAERALDLRLGAGP